MKIRSLIPDSVSLNEAVSLRGLHELPPLKHKRAVHNSRKYDLSGVSFGDWLVVSDLGGLLICKCKCGYEAKQAPANIIRGRTTSCRKCMAVRNVTLSANGLPHKPTRNTWKSMIERCYNTSHKFYPIYGGRGITVHESWKLSYDSFTSDMGIRPEGKSLDRINSDGNYCPNNCRWATQKEQCRNRRVNRRISINGTSKTIAEWTELSGLSDGTIDQRIKRGWSEDRLLIPSTQPWCIKKS